MQSNVFVDSVLELEDILELLVGHGLREHVAVRRRLTHTGALLLLAGWAAANAAASEEGEACGD